MAKKRLRKKRLDLLGTALSEADIEAAVKTAQQNFGTPNFVLMGTATVINLFDPEPFSNLYVNDATEIIICNFMRTMFRINVLDMDLAKQAESHLFGVADRLKEIKVTPTENNNERIRKSTRRLPRNSKGRVLQLRTPSSTKKSTCKRKA